MEFAKFPGEEEERKVNQGKESGQKGGGDDGAAAAAGPKDISWEEEGRGGENFKMASDLRFPRGQMTRLRPQPVKAMTWIQKLDT